MSVLERYARQLSMPEIGPEGQKRLARASVLVVGCGGLGSTLLYCLAGAGVGAISFADGDTVSPSNLNRQFLHTPADIGRNKTYSAMEKLSAFQPDARLVPIPRMLTTDTIKEDLAGFDLVIAAVDSIPARLMINSACMESGIPLIDGGVDGMCGTVTMVEPGITACLACLYGGVRPAHRAPASFAPVVSAISSMEAQLALLSLLGRPNPIRGKLLLYDAASMELQTLALAKNDRCPVCSGIR